MCVEPNEVEEVCFGEAFVQRAKASGKNPVYYILGQTETGRHLFCVVIQFPDGKGFPVTARPMTAAEKKRYNRWETMTSQRIPNTDSVEELARFWDTHDLTDFQAELEEVRAPVFSRRKEATVEVVLTAREAQALRRLAEAEGIKEAKLVRKWVREKLRTSPIKKPPNTPLQPGARKTRRG